MTNQTSKTQDYIDYLKVSNPGNEEMGILPRDKAHLSPDGNKLVAEQMLKVLGVALAEPEHSQRGLPLWWRGFVFYSHSPVSTGGANDLRIKIQ